MSKKQQPKAKVEQTPELTTEEFYRKATEDFVLLGHLIKYNLYILSKAIMFAAVYSKNSSGAPEVSVDIVNRIIDELDLDTKYRKEQEKLLAEKSLNTKPAKK